MRRGLLWMTVGMILYVVAALAALWAALAALLAGPRPNLAGALLSAVAFLAVVVVALVMSLLGLFMWYRRGLGILRRTWPEVSIGYTGVNLLLAGLAAAVVGVVVAIVAFASLVPRMPMAPAVPSMGAFLAAAGMLLAIFAISAILTIVGGILAFVVVAFKFYDRYRDSIYLVVGIFYIIGMVSLAGLLLQGLGILSIFALIANILFYVALGRLEGQPAPAPRQ